MSDCPGTAFWNFACQFYERPQVKDSLLWLQDHRDANVIMLLFCLWQGSQWNLVPVDFMTLARQLCNRWACNVISPTRESRRWLKSGDANDLYEKFKALELDAERHLINQLFVLWQRQLGPSQGKSVNKVNGNNLGHGTLICSQKNTGLYLAQAGIDICPEVKARIATLTQSL